jgi:hypothetical protein
LKSDVIAAHTAPAERMDRVEFGTKREAIDHVVELGSYRCPHCGKTTDFTSRHFRHRQPTASPLGALWVERFDALHQLNPDEWETALDFHCLWCHAPVRIIYAAGEVWAHGTNSWIIVDILEAASWDATR